MTLFAEICRNMITQRRLDKNVYYMYFIFEIKCLSEDLIGAIDIIISQSSQCNEWQRYIADKGTIPMQKQENKQ
jgi:hypothetical protein